MVSIPCVEDGRLGVVGTVETRSNGLGVWCVSRNVALLSCWRSTVRRGLPVLFWGDNHPSAPCCHRSLGQYFDDPEADVTVKIIFYILLLMVWYWDRCMDGVRDGPFFKMQLHRGACHRR